MSYEWPEYFQPSVVKEAFGGGILSTYTIALEAWRRGLHVVFHNTGEHFTVTSGERQVTFNHSRSLDHTTDTAVGIVMNKKKTTDILRANGILAPETVLFDTQTDTFDVIAEEAERLTYPVVLKPLSGTQGRGVLAGIQTREELEKSFLWLKDVFGAQRIVIEHHFEGVEYRLYVLGDECIAAGKKIPAHIIGDGNSTVDALIKSKNKSRKGNPFLSAAPIKRDYEVENYLERQGFTYSSVPEEGRYVRLRAKASGSAGGDFEDMTDSLPQHIREAAIKSLDAIPGLAAAGIDILHDTTREGPDDFVILEINSRAHIGLNMYPTQGVGRDIPEKLIDFYFPGSKRVAIDGLQNLRFSLGGIVAPLKTGRADTVSVKPLPKGGYESIRRIRFTDVKPITNLQHRRLQKLSQKWQVHGSYNPKGGILIIAGTVRSVRVFYKEVERVLDARIGGNFTWEGIVTVGFEIKSNTSV